jgi:hypothetical protein
MGSSLHFNWTNKLPVDEANLAKRPPPCNRKSLHKLKEPQTVYASPASLKDKKKAPATRAIDLTMHATS